MSADPFDSEEVFAMRRRLAESAIALSAEKAKLLTHIDMSVTVRMDDGSVKTTRTTSMPWKLGHGAWVVKLASMSGGYDCGRVTPAAAPEESEAAR